MSQIPTAFLTQKKVAIIFVRMKRKADTDPSMDDMDNMDMEHFVEILAVDLEHFTQIFHVEKKLKESVLQDMNSSAYKSWIQHCVAERQTQVLGDVSAPLSDTALIERCLSSTHLSRVSSLTIEQFATVWTMISFPMLRKWTSEEIKLRSTLLDDCRVHLQKVVQSTQKESRRQKVTELLSREKMRNLWSLWKTESPFLNSLPQGEAPLDWQNTDTYRNRGYHVANFRYTDSVIFGIETSFDLRIEEEPGKVYYESFDGHFEGVGESLLCLSFHRGATAHQFYLDRKVTWNMEQLYTQAKMICASVSAFKQILSELKLFPNELGLLCKAYLAAWPSSNDFEFIQ